MCITSSSMRKRFGLALEMQLPWSGLLTRVLEKTASNKLFRRASRATLPLQQDVLRLDDPENTRDSRAAFASRAHAARARLEQTPLHQARDNVRILILASLAVHACRSPKARENMTDRSLTP
eukprot:366449-Chlamydomonas_euryale.AAC.19